MSRHDGSTPRARAQTSHYAMIAREIRESGILPKLSITEQAVLFCVADMARWDTRAPAYRTCYFSKPKLAKELGIADRTVYRSIRSLVRNGILSVVGKHPIRIKGALAYELTIYRVADPVDLYEIVHGIWKPEPARRMDDAALGRIEAAKMNRQVNIPPDNRITPPPDPVVTPRLIRLSHPPQHGDHAPPDPVVTQKKDVEVEVEVEEEKEGYPLAENGDNVNDETPTATPPKLPGRARFNALLVGFTGEHHRRLLQYAKDAIADTDDRIEKDRIVNQICDEVERTLQEANQTSVDQEDKVQSCKMRESAFPGFVYSETDATTALIAGLAAVQPTTALATD